MPGPWEKYRRRTGPWTKYGKRADFGNVQSQAQTVAAAPEQPSPSIGERIGRDLGIGARATLEGVGSTLGIVTDPLARIAGLPSAREGFSSLADMAGLPKAEAPMERIGTGVTEALAGGGGIMGLGRSLATRAPGIGQAAGEFLSAHPTSQLLSLAGGSSASGVTRESGGSTGSQTLAGLVGGLAPSAGVATGSGLLRMLARGGEAGRQRMGQGIGDFRSVGAEPSVGQATGNRRMQGIESLLAGAPTSASVMARAAERQADDIGAGLQRRADDFFPNASAERAGRAINDGVRGDAGFIPRTREVADNLYSRVDATIPADSRVDVQATKRALSDLNASIEGAPNVAKFFQNARIRGIEDALTKDTDGIAAVLSRPGIKDRADALRAELTQKARNSEAEYQRAVKSVQEQNAQARALGMNNLAPMPQKPAIQTTEQIDAQVNRALSSLVDNKLPYEALTKLRTLVGNEIDNYSLVDNVPRSKWKALYGALSRDMESAATTPEAKAAWQRANTYYNARIKRLEAIDHVIERNGGPEKVFSAVMNGTRDGGTTLRGVMQSLDKEGQKAVTAAVIKRMGLPTPGQAGLGEAQFSAQTFLTNWNRVSPEAKRALFDRHGPQFARDMDKIARVADRIRTGSKVFANPSGSAKLGGALVYAGSLATALLTGQVGAFTVGATAGGLAHGLARAMNNASFVHWLARATELPVSALPQQVVVLKQVAERENDPELAALADSLQDLKGP
jgi:hypothetical protein